MQGWENAVRQVQELALKAPVPEARQLRWTVEKTTFGKLPSFGSKQMHSFNDNIKKEYESLRTNHGKAEVYAIYDQHRRLTGYFYDDHASRDNKNLNIRVNRMNGQLTLNNYKHLYNLMLSDAAPQQFSLDKNGVLLDGKLALPMKNRLTTEIEEDEHNYALLRINSRKQTTVDVASHNKKTFFTTIHYETGGKDANILFGKESRGLHIANKAAGNLYLHIPPPMLESVQKNEKDSIKAANENTFQDSHKYTKPKERFGKLMIRTGRGKMAQTIEVITKTEMDTDQTVARLRAAAKKALEAEKGKER